MIEVAVALATAEAAVEGIKKAISIGKQAQDCLGDFLQLFEARDAVQKASNEERAKLKPEDQRSAMSEAMESVIAARKIRDMERELQQYLVWSGRVMCGTRLLQNTHLSCKSARLLNLLPSARLKGWKSRSASVH